MKKATVIFITFIFFAVSSYAQSSGNNEHWQNYIFARIGERNYYLHEKVKTLFPNQCPNCRAFSFGAGPGNEVIDLIKNGWDVTASDISPTSGKVIEERAKMHYGKFSFQNRKFGDERMRGKYDYFFSFFALPFGDKKKVSQLIRHMSLYSKQNSLVALNFFGPTHDFVKSPKVFAMTEKDIRKLMRSNRFHILYFMHRNYDKPDTEGNIIHWDVFDVIARKK